jgi:hypothetical protein
MNADEPGVDDADFQAALDAEYAEWLRGLTLSTMPPNARATLMADGDVDWDKIERQLAVAFLAGVIEEAMADEGFVSTPTVHADGSVTLLWSKPG